MTQNRLIRGFGYGIGATIVMSLFMVVTTVTGASPMPEPIPKAMVATFFGNGLPKPVLLVLVVALHLGYGGFFGAVLARIAQPVTIWKGFGLGVVLWVVMQVAFLPFLGWGMFGTAITPIIAVATLVLHLIYGGILGWALNRNDTATTSKSLSPAD